MGICFLISLSYGATVFAKRSVLRDKFVFKTKFGGWADGILKPHLTPSRQRCTLRPFAVAFKDANWCLVSLKPGCQFVDCLRLVGRVQRLVSSGNKISDKFNPFCSGRSRTR